MKTNLNRDLKNGIAKTRKTRIIFGIALMMSLYSGAFAQQSTFPEYTSQAPVEFNLPLVLTQFNVTITNNKVKVNWITGKEKQLSHFVIEKSTNGVDFVEVGEVKAKGNSNVKITYSFTDHTTGATRGVICYRLKMVDLEMRYQRTGVEVVRLGEVKDAVNIMAYPNPVTTELRVTLPENWQEKQVVFDLYNLNGQLVKHIVNSNAGQTEIMNVADVSAGLYLMKVSTGTETSVQRIVKKP